MFSPEESERYSRHFRLRDFGTGAQERLKNARVLVIGAGGLGSPVLMYLAAAGVGTLGIADDDKVSLSNLQRQVLYATSSVGKDKATEAAEKLRAMNPEIQIRTHPVRVNHTNADSLFREYDIIVDTTDNIPARYQINDACVRTGRPLVYGAIFRWEGQVTVFNYQGGPTYRCLFPDPPGDMVLSCDQEGVVGVVPGIIGSMQALETLKIITGKGEVLDGRLLSIDLMSHTQRTIRFSKKQESLEVAHLKEHYEELTASEFREIRENITILDVRRRDEFAERNSGGLNIPLNELDQRIAELAGNKNLIVVCASGRRSLEAIRRLYDNGYQGKCYNLTRGLEGYLDEIPASGND